MSANRNPWTLEVRFTKEDHNLKCLVQEYGVSKWSQISRALKSTPEEFRRSGKQCRERWHNHLNPEINKNSWSETEKSFILHLHKIYGNHWSLISKYLPGRSDNAIKNFFYSLLRKNSRQDRNKTKKYEQMQKVKTIKREKTKKSEEAELDSEASAILISLSKGKSRVKKCENIESKVVETVSPDLETNNYEAELSQNPLIFVPKPLFQYFTNYYQLNEHPVSLF